MTRLLELKIFELLLDYGSSVKFLSHQHCLKCEGAFIRVPCLDGKYLFLLWSFSFFVGFFFLALICFDDCGTLIYCGKAGSSI